MRKIIASIVLGSAVFVANVALSNDGSGANYDRSSEPLAFVPQMQRAPATGTASQETGRRWLRPEATGAISPRRAAVVDPAVSISSGN